MSAVLAKRCTKCSENKPLTEFRKNSRYADGHVTWCSECSRAYSAEHYRQNREKVAEQSRAWHIKNRDTRNAKSRAIYAANPAVHAERVKRYREENIEACRERAKLNARKRRASRVDVRLRSRISSQFRYCLSTGKGGRTTASLLGYSIAELRVHLERQFLKGMGWDNMGKWHVDHIVPLSSFDITGPDCPDLKRAWALPNLRPVWAEDNLAKGAKRTVLV